MEENQKTSDQELNKCLSQVHELDKDKLINILGIQKQSQTFVFHFFQPQNYF